MEYLEIYGPAVDQTTSRPKAQALNCCCVEPSGLHHLTFDDFYNSTRLYLVVGRTIFIIPLSSVTQMGPAFLLSLVSLKVFHLIKIFYTTDASALLIRNKFLKNYFVIFICNVFFSVKLL